MKSDDVQIVLRGPQALRNLLRINRGYVL